MSRQNKKAKKKKRREEKLRQKKHEKNFPTYRPETTPVFDGATTTRAERDAAAATYADPVAKLFTVGRPRNEPPSYSALGLTAEHVPELIRMSSDEVLRDAGDADVDRFYAIIHAWQALGELRAESAIPTLLEILENPNDEFSDWTMNTLPEVFSRIGRATISPLEGFLMDETKGLYPRVTAADALQLIGRQYPESRDESVAIISRQLEKYEQNEPALNGFLVANLLDLKAREALPVIGRAFAADRVEPGIAGNWATVKAELEEDESVQDLEIN